MSIFESDSVGSAYERPLRELPTRLIDALDLVRELRAEAERLSVGIGRYSDSRTDRDRAQRDRIHKHAEVLASKIELRTGWSGLGF